MRNDSDEERIKAKSFENVLEDGVLRGPGEDFIRENRLEVRPDLMV